MASITDWFRRSINYNIYTNQVYEPVTFEGYSTTQLRDLYSTLTDVRIIEGFISQEVAKVPVGVFRKDKEVFRTPLNALMDEPNSHQGWAELIEEMMIW